MCFTFIFIRRKYFFPKTGLRKFALKKICFDVAELLFHLYKPVFVKYLAANNYSGFPGGSAGKESTYNAGDLGLIPGLEKSPGEGNGYPL